MNEDRPLNPPVIDIDRIEPPAMGPILMMTPQVPPETYWGTVARQFRKSKMSVAGLMIVLLLFAIAIFADFIANDKPLMMKYQGVLYFPVTKDYLVRVGLS